MHRAIVLVLFASVVVSASCVDGDLADPASTGSCAPGRQASCACGGGLGDGFQVCKEDGSGFGACVCNDAAVVDASADTGVAMSDSTPLADTTVATDTTVTTPDTMMPVDTSTGPTWVWLDRGGPAFEPHSCPDGPGVTGGKLVDPEAFFAALIKGKSAKDWMMVMNAIEPSLWACGLGQQRDSGGTVRGRLFLPTAACPDASPPAGDALAIKLGVRQLPECWTHAVDVVDGG
jgi:hypothetical protein